MSTSLEALSAQGVAVWVDSIARRWLEDGALVRLRDTRSVVGVTSNPTIFEQALRDGDRYAADLARFAADGLAAPAIFERLALDDIRAAAEVLAPVYAATDGRDGYVSFEVAPDLAHDTAATSAEAARLFAAIDRPNAMIKIPATAEGLPAIRAAIAAGINVNVTLIFSIARYEAVAEAYLSGLEDRLAAGGQLASVASVASFFVSRVDTLLDPRLAALAAGGGPQAALASARIGTAAIDNAKLAYAAWERIFDGPRWEALAAHGAQPQRCLWASTSTKNPDYRDVVYCEELIGHGTVNTMPLATLEAFADHGKVRGQCITEGRARAERLWADLAELGIAEETVAAELEADGVKKFAASFADLLAVIAQASGEGARPA